jgi:hypothetical protein
MSKYIEFYVKETGQTISKNGHVKDYNDYFVRNGYEVWCDNDERFDEQRFAVGFDDCIRRCENIGWRVIDE